MFELIGLVFATGLLFVVATAVSAVLVSVIWFLLRSIGKREKYLLVLAAIIPLASAAYFWLCIAILPGESLFGDINQPLPNGYSLTALGKMPDFASIANPDLPYRRTGLSQCIGTIAVDGPFVVGQYSHPFGSFESNTTELFFEFDTRASVTTEFSSQAELERQLGHAVTLNQVQAFRSTESSYRRQHRLNRTIEFGPPIVAVFLLLLVTVHARARIRAGASNIYT